MGESQIQMMAEGEGFEPPVTLATTVFKTAYAGDGCGLCPPLTPFPIEKHPSQRGPDDGSQRGLLQTTCSKLVATALPEAC